MTTTGRNRTKRTTAGMAPPPKHSVHHRGSRELAAEVGLTDLTERSHPSRDAVRPATRVEQPGARRAVPVFHDGRRV